jgi:hypothetical protein
MTELVNIPVAVDAAPAAHLDSSSSSRIDDLGDSASVITAGPIHDQGSHPSTPCPHSIPDADVAVTGIHTSNDAPSIPTPTTALTSISASALTPASTAIDPPVAEPLTASLSHSLSAPSLYHAPSSFHEKTSTFEVEVEAGLEDQHAVEMDVDSDTSALVDLLAEHIVPLSSSSFSVESNTIASSAVALTETMTGKNN